LHFIKFAEKTVAMKQYLFILLLLSTAFLQAAAQDNKPEEKTVVNKEFDEKGNLIRYDSTFVWSWSGDSAFQFEFPVNSFFSGNGFPGFDESILDSAFSNQFNNHLFNFEPFQNDDFFSHFQQQFGDSASSKQFDFPGDSAFVFPFEFGNSFGNDFFSKDFDAIHEILMKQLNDMNSEKPDFESKEEGKEWNELLEKQKIERQEMKKRLKVN